MDVVFVGQYRRSIDEKGRIAVPSELRSALGPGAMLTRGFDGCLCIYPASTWHALAQAVEELPDMRYEARTAARALFSGAVPCAFDRQGRVAIPAFLRDHAALNGDAMIVGVGNRVEIWSRSSWLQEHGIIQSEGRRLAEALAASQA
ncbi:MAG TPA: division/cell wall cluster transcriptional repressor MraZ [Acidobacteriaceae bacterium]|nr:division/cell wall cluster transcriptional repressor MraZ [Acidobacteriaceae bacterium]